jgi:hypothetical protein
VVLDGELGSVEVKPNRTPPGPTLADLYAFYGMAIGTAAKAVQECRGMFVLRDAASVQVPRRCRGATHPLDWRDDDPLVPDASASRWFVSDYQRNLSLAATANRRSHPMPEHRVRNAQALLRQQAEPTSTYCARWCSSWPSA